MQLLEIEHHIFGETFMGRGRNICLKCIDSFYILIFLLGTHTIKIVYLTILLLRK